MTRRLASDKQLAYWREADHRWNVKVGATRSGKTYMDYYLIPRRLLAVKGKEGLDVILGNTRETIRRNVIEPMQAIYGADRVSSIHADLTCTMFGERVFCLGADNVRRVDKLRGTSIKYCYGDEVVTWNPEVFTMLKSRLDKPYSRFDGTCNPEGPEHWFKAFLDGNADIYQQQYTLDDNPFLDPVVKESIKQEYAGTVFYDRYVLGRWVAAEGVVYRLFADRAEDFIRDPGPNEVRYAVIGIDFGGNGSAHAFVTVGFDARFRTLGCLDEYYRKEIITPAELERDYVDYVRAQQSRWKIVGVFADSAEQVLIRGLNAAGVAAGLKIEAQNAQKREILDRIRFACRMMGAGRFYVSPRCVHLIDALRTARWNEKHVTRDERLDDGTTNIDSLDAMEYAFERFMGDMVR